MGVKVITPPAEEPITVAEAKEHLRVIGEDDDAYIETLITAARQMAEGRLNRALLPQTLQVTLDAWPDIMIRLPRPPLISVESISYVDADGAPQTVDADAYVVLDYVEPGGVLPAFNTPWPTARAQPNAITVRYTAGFADGVPRPIVQWMLLVIGAMYNNRESVVAGVAVNPLPAEFQSWFLQPYMVYE